MRLHWGWQEAETGPRELPPVAPRARVFTHTPPVALGDGCLDVEGDGRLRSWGDYQRRGATEPEKTDVKPLAETRAWEGSEGCVNRHLKAWVPEARATGPPGPRRGWARACPRRGRAAAPAGRRDPRRVLRREPALGSAPRGGGGRPRPAQLNGQPPAPQERQL